MDIIFLGVYNVKIYDLMKPYVNREKYYLNAIFRHDNIKM